MYKLSYALQFDSIPDWYGLYKPKSEDWTRQYDDRSPIVSHGSKE